MKATRRRPATLAAACLALSALALPAAASPPPPTRLLQVSLLVASKSGGNELADLPANTRQAVEDVRQFLPFKSYRLLDTALLRTDRHARTKLRGPGGRDFKAMVQIGHESGKVVVRHFNLVEYVQRETPKPPAGDGDAGAANAPSAPESGTRTVLSSSFAADVGQTVVVGSSRLNGGDEALVVLFTALP